MSKRGENIYKRKDGRWEGRYIKERSADGKARYGKDSIIGLFYKESVLILKDVDSTSAQPIGNLKDNLYKLVCHWRVIIAFARLNTHC